MIIIKTKKELEIMRQAGLIVADTLERLAGLVKPGITTAALDHFAERYIVDRGAKASFKGTMGFQRQFVFQSMKMLFTGYQVNVA